MRNTIAAMLLVCLASTGHSQVTWRDLPQHMFSFGERPVYADLDGDGAKEIVFVSSGMNYLALSGGIGVLRFDTDQFEQVDLFALGHLHRGLVVTPGAGGRDHVLVSVDSDGDNARVVELAGLPLRPVREFSGLQFIPDLVADVDGDGLSEMVGRFTQLLSVWSRIAVLDLATGAVKWSGPQVTGDVAAQQLDPDPALEIIAGSLDHPGQIFDGATGLTEWTYPGGLRGAVVAGRFEADSSTPTFAEVSNGRLRIFRGAPYSPLREYELPWSTQWPAAIDFDHDGIDEIVMHPDRIDGIGIVNPLTGSFRTVAADWWTASPIGVGRMVPLGPVLAAYVGRDISTFTGMKANVVNLANGDSLFRASVESGPFQASGFGDLNGDGIAEAVVANLHQRDVNSDLTAGVRVLDASGNEIAKRKDIVPGSSSQAPNLLIADLDGNPGDEIILKADTPDGPALIVMNGVTLADHWRMTGIQAQPFTGQVELHAVDVDGDGRNEIAILEHNGSGSRIAVFSGRDGSAIWRSVTLKPNHWSSAAELAIHDVDGDPLAEMLALVGNGVYAFDVTTRLLEWSFTVENVAGNPVSLTAWGTGSACRFAVAMTSGIVVIHRCDDRTRTALVQGPPAPSMIVPLDDTGRLALTAQGTVWTIEPDGSVARHTDFLGVNLGGTAPNAVHALPDGDVHLLVGSDLQAIGVRIRPQDIFANGFE